MTPPGSTDHATPLTRATKVIAVADVVESVRLMEQDEQEFIRRWQSFVGFVQQRLPAESGRIHKSLGDGLMLEFSDPHGCIRAALAMRAWLAESNERLPPEDQVQLRIGAHVADFVADEYDIYGTDVNLAARIASLAGPGEIVISAALRRHLDPQPAMVLQDLGSCHLKHVKEPVHAFRIGEAGQAPVMPVRRLATHSLRPTVAVLPFGMERPAAGGLTARRWRTTSSRHWPTAISCRSSRGCRPRLSLPARRVSTRCGAPSARTTCSPGAPAAPPPGCRSMWNWPMRSPGTWPGRRASGARCAKRISAKAA